MAVGRLMGMQRRFASGEGAGPTEDKLALATPEHTMEVGSFAHHILVKCSEHNDRVAYKRAQHAETDKQTISFNEVLDISLQVASGLRREGITRGQTVAVYLPNDERYTAYVLGVIASGAKCALINPMLTPYEAQHELVTMETRMVLTSRGLKARAQEAAGMVPGHTVHTPKVIAVDNPDEFKRFRGVVDGGILKEECDPDAIALIPFSHGLGGVTKGAQFTHRALLTGLAQMEAAMTYGTNERFLLTFPLFHTFGFLQSSLALAGGVEQRLLLRTQFEMVERELKNGLTRLTLVPSLAAGLADYLEGHKRSNPGWDLREILYLGGTPHPGVVQRLEHILGVKPRRALTMTELGMSHISGPETPEGSVGRPLPGTEAKLLHPSTQAPVEAGTEGELWIKGPQMMDSYAIKKYSDIDFNKSAFREGRWMRTGDLARIDEAGNLFITGKLKRVFKFKGLQIDPNELREVLLGHPDIEDAKVTAEEDGLGDDLMSAVVALTYDIGDYSDEQRETLAGGIVDFVSDRVSPHKILRGGIEFHEDNSTPLLPDGPQANLLE